MDSSLALMESSVLVSDYSINLRNEWLPDYWVVDRRTGYCFRQLMSGMCTTHTDGLMQVTKADCCCTMGAAWGPMCEHCPRKGTEEYEELCLEVGYSVDGHGKT